MRVRATGLCGTDLKARRGDLGIQFPRVLGHEIAGEVVSSSPGAESGTPVACYIYESCQTCPECRAGAVTYCSSSRRLGLERDGGLAEFVCVPTRSLIPFDDGVDFGAAAVAMDAVATVWAAVEGRVSNGDSVVVVGDGGLGLHALQVLKSLGARVAVSGLQAKNLEMAVDLGADVVIHGMNDDVASAVHRWTRGSGADLVLEVSGTVGGMRDAVGCAATRGSIVSCGYSAGSDFKIPSTDLVLRGLNIVGSRSATLLQAEDALSAVARGDVEVVIDRRVGLDDADAALDCLAEGGVTGRVIVDQVNQ